MGAAVHITPATPPALPGLHRLHIDFEHWEASPLRVPQQVGPQAHCGCAALVQRVRVVGGAGSLPELGPGEVGARETSRRSVIEVMLASQLGYCVARRLQLGQDKLTGRV